MKNTELLIIGAGPGGYETAVAAAKRGMEVTVVESARLGGTCLNRGCIPTKALCKNAALLDELSSAGEFGIEGLSYKFDFKSVVNRKNAVIEQLRNGVAALLSQNKVNVAEGCASFTGPHTVEVKNGSVSETYFAENIIIATGSEPVAPKIPGVDLPGVIVSEAILDLESVPSELCIIGGGVIGLEFASIFRSFGSNVTVIEFCDEILPRFDGDIAKRLRNSLGKRGIDIRTKSKVESIVPSEGGLEVFYNRKGKEESVKADKVLVAVGRRPRLSSLNLDVAEVGYSPKGIIVNEFMQTSAEGIYAIGDVTGQIMLAHAATAQGRKALAHIAGYEDDIDLSLIPSVVFTSPEAASVGMTAEDCRNAGIEYEEVKSFFRANGKAVTLGETDGLCKIVIDKKTGRILGCHIYGPHSSDLISEMTLAAGRKLTLDEVRAVVHAHPTLSEIFI